MTDKELMELAQKAREYSYCPYSRFRVGAALLARSGRAYTGCNIENAAYPAGVCAERTAIFKAVSEGERAFEAIAIVGGRERETADLTAPCGICRQVMAEFGGEEFKILLGSPEKYQTYTLKSLLPLSFTEKNL